MITITKGHGYHNKVGFFILQNKKFRAKLQVPHQMDHMLFNNSIERIFDKIDIFFKKHIVLAKKQYLKTN